jgi:CheY-like chemotaxis protein
MRCYPGQVAKLSSPTEFEAVTRSWDALRRPIWLFDPHALRGVYANKAALRLWGAVSAEELLSRDFSQLSPAVRARTDRLASETAGGDSIDERWTFYPNGQPVTVQATISTIRMGDGRPVLLFEAAPSEVEAGERRAVEALRHTSTLITLFGPDGEPIFANPAAYAAYGSADHPFNARFTDPSQGGQMLAQALAGEIVGAVCQIVTAAGRRWHHLDARPVLDPVTGAGGVLLNERDVTARVEAERARAAAEQKAAMAEARQKFLADMSHELRTPLNSVIGFSELMAAGGLPGEHGRHASRVHDSGKQLLSVVNEMIRLSELEGWRGEAGPTAGRPESRREPQASPPGRELRGPSTQRSPRVLYVDDNESNRALVTAMLATQDVRCQTADDGAQGLEAARAGDWDLILMDIQMPVMDGVAATRAIRALPSPAGAVPIVALTANTLAEQLQAYAAAGMDDVIAKPVDMAELIAKVDAWSRAGRPLAEPVCPSAAASG